MIAQPPGDARRQGDTLLELGRHEEALAAYGSGLAQAPEDGRLLWGVASACLALDRIDEAGRAATAAVRANPHDPDAHHVMCRVYRRAGRAEEARRHAERAVALAPFWPEAAWLRVVTAIESNHADDAVAVGRWMVQRFPDRHLAHLGMAWAAMGKVRRPETPWWLFPLALLTNGVVLLVVGVRWAMFKRRSRPWQAEADRHLQEALRLGADDPRVHRIAAIVLGFRGDWSGALERRVTAARQDPRAGEGEELLAAVRRRVARNEVIAAVGAWFVVSVAADLTGVVGALVATACVVGTLAWWAGERRRHVARTLPGGIARRLQRGAGWWLGPAAAVVAAALLFAAQPWG